MFVLFELTPKQQLKVLEYLLSEVDEQHNIKYPPSRFPGGGIARQGVNDKK